MRERGSSYAAFSCSIKSLTRVNPKVDPFVKTGGRAVVRATLLLFLPSYFLFRMNQSVYLLNTLQQESGNQGPDGAADDYKTRNSCLTAGELLSVRYSHANRLLHI